jgi:hypothetical protein
LSRKCEALSSIPSTTKERKRKEGKKGEKKEGKKGSFQYNM